MEVDRRHVVKLQGKDFITYDGLLDMAHQMGLVSIKTEMISFENGVVIFKATAKTETQEFDGYGDTDDSNVNKMIARHKIRMAETRAKARALRDLTNVGMCSVEEMGGDDTDKHGNSTVYEKATEIFEDENAAITPDDVPFDKTDVVKSECEQCQANMTQGQMTISQKKYGRVLCPKCQKEVA